MKILVVEDNPEHMKAAVVAIQAVGHEAVQATNLLEGDRRLIGYGIAGVITDLFIPDGVVGATVDEADQPRGLGIMLRARREGIPCIICTEGYHHGSKYNWICSLGRDFGWPEIVDSIASDGDDNEAESQSKNWQEALDTLLEMIDSNK